MNEINKHDNNSNNNFSIGCSRCNMTKLTDEQKKANKKLRNTKYYYAVTKLKRQLKRIEILKNRK